MFLTKTKAAVALLAALALVAGDGQVRAQPGRGKFPPPPAGKWVPPAESPEVLAAGTSPRYCAARVPHPEAVLALGFAPDGKTVFSGDGGGALRRWNLDKPREIARLDWDKGCIMAVAAASAGKDKLLIAGAYQTHVRIWDEATGKVLHEIPAACGSISLLAFSPDGKRLAVNGLGSGVNFCFCFYDVATGKPVDVVPAGAKGTTVAVVPDFKSVLTLDGGKLHLWDVGTGKEVRQFPVGFVGDAAFSSDGKALLTLENSAAARVWDVTTGKKVCEWAPAPGSFFLRAALSPDGRRVAVIGRDGSGFVGEVPLGTKLFEFTTRPMGPLPLAFSPDGKVLAFGDWDKLSLVWERKLVARRGRLTAKELDVLWSDLDRAGGPGRDAVWQLAEAPGQAVSFLNDRLHPPAAKPERLAKLIADLDDDDFDKREAASVELANLGDQAEAALRKAWDGQPSAEVRYRVGALLGRLEGKPLPAHRVRALRAVQALELIDSDEARKVLGALAADKGRPWLAREAKAALGRLDKR
jgi:WD40 repeat protein